MRSLRVVSLLVAGLGCWLADGALAADLAPKAEVYKAVPPPAPTYFWTGCYIGTNVGWGWAHNDYNDPLAAPPANALGGHSANGVMLGGQTGCDYQFGSWVVGLQGQFDGADMSATHLGIDDFFTSRNFWFGSATGRIGYTWLPNLLAYARGGAAWLRNDETKVDLATGLLEGRATNDRFGWLVGAGLEYQTAPGWSIFVEYDFVDFGTRRVDYTNFEAPVPPTFPIDIKQTMQIAEIGFNYRWGGMPLR
jgi:outer membrane immunogenic protein